MLEALGNATVNHGAPHKPYVSRTAFVYNTLAMPRSQSGLKTFPVWQLELLGSARLKQGDKTHGLERLSVALLAYLALEGPMPRSLLAGMLWSDRTEEAARANLRQRLKRLRDTANTDLLLPGEPLQLRPDLEVDAVRLESLVFMGETTAALIFKGEFLAGHDYADSPDLQAWVEATRGRLKNVRLEALEAEANRFEREGDLHSAVLLTEQCLRLDQYVESAHRRLIQLHYLAGNRSAVLNAHAHYRDVFEQELGIAVSPEMAELVSLIEQGTTPIQPISKQTAILPLSLQRPPVLVGRAQEWAQLEAAWTKGQMIVISGEAGAGKTRLAQDFMISKGNLARFEARAGDGLVSYSTQARLFRQMLTDYPVVLPDWVRQELCRILPELGSVLTLMQNETDKLRFHQAQTEAARLAMQAGMNLVLLEDLQFFDAASFEVSYRMFAELMQHGTMRVVFTCRETDLSPVVSRTLEQAFSSGTAVQIKLEHFNLEAVDAFLISLAVNGLERLGAAMHSATGGNPMFVLETARNLLTSGMLEHVSLGALPLPNSVGTAIRSRLARLSAPALRLARIASVAETDFSLALAANVLESHALDLTESLQELEAAQVMVGNAFAHDLIFEATLENLPRTVRILLHQRVAEYLETHQAHPVRVAHHWFESGDGPRAASQWLLAARMYQDRSLYQDALNLLERVLAHGGEDQQTQAHLLIADIHREARRYDEARLALEPLLAASVDPRVRVEALRVKAYLSIGDHQESARLTGEAYRLALELHDHELIHKSLTSYAAALLGLGETDEASRLLEPHLAATTSATDPRWRIRLLGYLGAVYAHAGRHEESSALLLEAHQLCLDTADPYWQVLIAAFLINADLERNQPETHLDLAQAALELGPFDVSEYLQLNLARTHLELGDFDNALRLLLSLPAHALGATYLCLALSYLAQAHHALKQPSEALASLRRALELVSTLKGAPRAVAQVVVSTFRFGGKTEIKKAQVQLERLEARTVSPADRRALELVLQDRGNILKKWLDKT